jgi:hypothetical protein
MAEKPLVCRWREALCAASLPMAAKAVGHTLAVYANSDGTFVRSGGRNFNPGRPKIAAGAGCSVRTVDHAIKDLEAGGLLDCRRARVRGRNRVNRYTLTLPAKSANAAPGKRADAAHVLAEDLERTEGLAQFPTPPWAGIFGGVGNQGGADDDIPF